MRLVASLEVCNVSHMQQACNWDNQNMVEVTQIKFVVFYFLTHLVHWWLGDTGSSAIWKKESQINVQTCTIVGHMLERSKNELASFRGQDHRVATLVADKLETEKFTLVWKTNWIRQPKKQLPCSSYNHNTMTNLRTSVKESLQMHFKVAVIQRWLSHRCSEGY